MNKQIFALAFVAASTLAACSKDEATPGPSPTPDPKPTPSSTATPSYGSGDGAVVALLTRTTTSSFGVEVDMDLGTGVAVFGNLATGAYTDAGKITLNGTELAKQANNSYVFIPGVSKPTGIDLGSDIKWVVTTPSFTYDASSAAGGRGMPKAGKIDGSYTFVDISKDFTLSVSGTITKSDSVYFQINGASKSILKRMAAGTTSVTFTASELAGLGKTAGGSVTVAPWNHEEQSLGGKKIHVINELALSRTVEIK
ncbi:MAG: hypothetical protein JNL13_13265 [Chitinophagaceae bacterium]|nr:hypothetical protein [Chitinophagaceae bacterium]